MSSRIILIDDVDGSTPATETIRFAFDGSHYEVDLCTDNATRLRDALAPFIAVGRRSGVERGSRVVPVKRKYTPRKTAAVVAAAEAPRVKRKYTPRKKAVAAVR